MKRAARGFTRISTFGEEMPNIENRIELASDKDEFGMPLGRIIHSYDQDAVALWNANFEEGLKIAKAAGAKEVWSGARQYPTIHLHGRHHHGHGRGNSVVNSYGQTPRDCRTSTSRGPASSRPKAPRTRPTRSSPCPRGARSNWRRNGATVAG